MRPAKTQISLGIRLVWPESSLSAWRKLRSLATHWVHSEDSDQNGHPPCLISLRCPREESFGPKLPIECTAKTLIRLGGCPGWSESSLGAQSLCWFGHVRGSYGTWNISVVFGVFGALAFEQHRDKTNKMACAPSEDSGQPGHLPSLIRVFALHLMGS